MELKNTKGVAYSTGILLVLVIVLITMLISFWPKGKNFEQATELDRCPEWNKAKTWVQEKISNLKNKIKLSS